ncbi:hypothetical protein Tsubulata_050740 [Turnera subulata]|uniref:Uncharacterized protein n=1 Tax=Turnera subulata TaxID=218843 RepID=A0A9Q0FJS5_9ROSI|nr:hypothetical protein Tsubulata_050740 [Turnera subulata]
MPQVSRTIQLCPQVFEEMDNLRLLRFYFKGNWYKNPTKLHLPQCGLEYLPNTLRLLHWDFYPSPSLPSIEIQSRKPCSSQNALHQPYTTLGRR